MNTPDLEFPFLEEVHTPTGPTLIDFVFVHGLNPRARNDHPFKTWTHENGTFWPRDYLPQDIPQARVFIYGYNSSVTDPMTMSTASIKDHANTLLNLLDMERNAVLHARAPKIIFICHSLGGLVAKQALLNAHEDRKYTSIRTDTFGLVFFGTPHRGAKGVELGKIATKVARFVSKGNASNDLLKCLEENSLFTRQMSSRFSQQLEDYQIISFVEGKEVFIGGAGPASISHLVVDEESAILGLPGLRETRLKLDADHSQMCKVGSRGAMYKLIKGNIKQIADQVLISEQGFIPQPSSSPNPGPPLPPRMHNNSSVPYPAPPRSPNPTQNQVTGSLFNPADNDPRSIQVAKHMNNFKWDDARRVQYAIFQEHHRTLGQDHHSTLLAGHYLSEIEYEAQCIIKAAEWGQWVCNNTQRALGKKHELTMKAESLIGVILCRQGKPQEGESICADVLTRQQMTIGENHLDTLETRRRLAIAYGDLGRRQEAIQAMTKFSEKVGNLLGKTHIKYFASVLDIAEQVVFDRLSNNQQLSVRRFTAAPDTQAQGIEDIFNGLTTLLGPRHPLTIRAMWLHGEMEALNSDDSTSGSETLRRALAIAEEHLGPEHRETMNLVAFIGMMYAQRVPPGENPYTYDKSANLTLALPWLQRYLNWAESVMGAGAPDVQTLLQLIADMYFAGYHYQQALPFFERLVASYRASRTAVPRRVQTHLELCQMNAQYLTPAASAGGLDLSNILSSFRRL